VGGTVRRAPRWMQRAGLEWLFRFYSEPRRLWKRYLVGNLKFCGLIARELIADRMAR
jgi:N-acetylglucosaminyldiphosphoundecaprenol N-acetyl-beta-D-mannosaminyltransferase